MGYTEAELAKVVEKTANLIVQDLLNSPFRVNLRRRGYTIVGYFKHNTHTWFERVKVKDPTQILPALAKKVSAGEFKHLGKEAVYNQPSNWVVTAVFEGYINPQLSPTMAMPLSKAKNV